MRQVSDEEIDYILNDIIANGVVIEDLQNNLLDHICCIIENEMPENEDFYTFYECVMPRFFNNDLKEIQAETENLLTFKSFYAMKTTLKISGITSVCFTLLGAILKSLHLPGAGLAIVLGGLTFSLVFLPLMITLKFKDEESKVDKWVFTFGFTLGIGASLGIVFKLMHWPYANFLMFWSIALFVFAYVPIYFMSRIRRPEIKFNTTVNSVLMVACGGMLFALFNLKGSKATIENLVASHIFMEHNISQFQNANQKKRGELKQNITPDLFSQTSHQLFSQIEKIKINLVSIIEDLPKEDAEKFDITKLRRVDDFDIVKKCFEYASGEMSLEGLTNSIKEYNKLIKTYYPEDHEKHITLNKLQLENATIAVLVQQLTQIQLQVVTNENNHLTIAFVKQ
jgi:hypothetical protein